MFIGQTRLHGYKLISVNQACKKLVVSDGETIVEYSTAGKSDITEDKILMTIDDD